MRWPRSLAIEFSKQGHKKDTIVFWGQWGAAKLLKW